MAKHEQNTDLVETWNINTSDDIWALGENASIEVGNDVGEQYGHLELPQNWRLPGRFDG